MRKELNNVLVLMTVGTLVMNGCASKKIVIIDNQPAPTKQVAKPIISSWGNLKNSSTAVKREIKSVTKTAIKSNKVSSDFQNPQMGSIAFGKAILYGQGLEGKRTASGDVFNLNAKTAAHKSLPFNTMVKVTNLRNNKSEVVRINDRKTFSDNKILNLSPSVAKSLNIPNGVTTDVKVEILGFDGVVVDKFHTSNQKKTTDCVDCVVSIPKRTDRIASVKKPFKSLKKVNNSYSYEDEILMAKKSSEVTHYSKPVKENYAENTPYEYDENQDEPRYASTKPIDSTPTIENFSQKTAIQIGAFRKYAGAKVYAKKYALLSNQYNVEIKENFKNNEPLYRVRIEGFHNELEAREFINRYDLSGAFLVRK